MRVRVVVCFVPQHHSTLFECANDERVCLKHLDAGVVGNFLREFASTIYRHNKFDAVVFTYLIVVFTETRCHVHHACSIFGSNEVAAKYAERSSMICEVWKQRRIPLANKF